VGESDETPESARSASPGTSRSLVLAFRVALLVGAAASVVVAVVVSARGSAAGGAAVGRYVCPMHADVKAAAAGQCPICGMALEPVARNDVATRSGRSREMAGMADMTAVENVKKHRSMDFARIHSLLPDLREMRGPGWFDDDDMITAIYYNDQIAALAPDESGTFFATDAPGATWAIRRTAAPAEAWDNATSRIRFRLVADPRGRAPAHPPRPGQVGWIELPRKPREVLAVPAAALLEAPEGPYVLVAVANGAGIEKRPIEIGEIFMKQGFVVVLSGLRVHDRVVSRAAFFLDADRRQDSQAEEGGWVAP